MLRSCILLLLLTAVLFGQVRYRHGDDPQWASPNFDDRDWATSSDGPVPPARTRDSLLWIRTHITVPANSPAPDAVMWPDNCGDVFGPGELFLNGVHVASIGTMPRGADFAIIPRKCVFSVPPGLVVPGQTVTIAVRTWSGLWFDRQHEFTAIRLGSQELLQEQAARLRTERVIVGAADLLSSVLLGLLGTGLLVLWKTARGQPLLFWFSIWLIVQALEFGMQYVLICTPHAILSARRFVIFDFVFGSAGFGVAMAFVCAAFGLKRAGVLRTLQAVGVLRTVPYLLIAVWRPDPLLVDSISVVAIIVSLLLLALSLYGISQPGEGRWAALPLLLFTALNFSSNVLHVSFSFRLGLVQVEGWTIGVALMSLVISLILIRRTWRHWRSRERLHGEVRGAQEVQAALMPAKAPRIPGFEIDAVCLPAEEVGGDFYRIYPCDSSSSLFLAGDVSGKGLKAAMVVSMVAGAADAIVRQTTSPAEVLSRINQVVTGRLDGGFVTCCCVRLDAAGTYTIANAGHVPPYVQGRPLVTEFGLPLGIDPDASWTEVTGVLPPGETIVLLSDGIVEARRPTGELYGFDRLEADMAAFGGAATLAERSRNFGQEDDITVVAITRREAGAHAA